MVAAADVLPPADVEAEDGMTEEDGPWSDVDLAEEDDLIDEDDGPVEAPSTLLAALTPEAGFNIAPTGLR